LKQKRVNRKGARDLTIPKPFHFHYLADRRHKEASDDTKSPFVPLVEKLKQFEKNLDKDQAPSVRIVLGSDKT
jgi:hypothetical protein